MLRILQIGLGPNPGGIESCILNYHRNIDKTKFTFDYADIYGNGLAHSAEIEALGGKIYKLPNYKKHPIKMARQLGRIIKEQNYDIVHINMLSAANMLPVRTAVKRGCGKVIVHCHNSAVPTGFLRTTLNNLNLNALRNLTVEKWACGVKAGQWMWGEAFDTENVIPNAIDSNRFTPVASVRKNIREMCGFKDEDVIVGFVGRFSEQKNVLFLPEILSELKKHSAEYKMLLVGDGDLKTQLQEKFSAFGLDGQVYYAGVQSNAADWYQAMDAFVLPSLFEGLPVVGIEAQANGLPCFLSNTITGELNITGTIQYLPIDGSAKVWADKIIDVLGETIRGNVAFPNEYEITFAAKKLEEKYASLLAGS